MLKKIKESLPVVASIVLALALVLGVVYSRLEQKKHDDEILRLQNEIASRDVTIEVAKGVYSKLALRSERLDLVLKNQGAEIDMLLERLKKNKEDLLTVNKVAIRWKNAYEASIKGQQTEDVNVDTGVVRKRVVFEHDFGYLGIVGHTITDPPEAFVRVFQNRPLILSLVVSQDKTKVWKTSVTSSEENIDVDVQLAAVNPFVLSPKWYEKVGVGLTVAPGSTPNGLGALIGTSLTYPIGNFDVGPAAYLSVSDSLSTYIGVSALWHPFKR